MRNYLREPLVHFLAAGLMLFALFKVVGDKPKDDPKSIVVDRNALLTFMQYRSKAFDPSVFETKLDSMPEEERARLIDDYVREEVLHREAKALGLDREDYVIRRRLVQKVEFIAEGFAQATAEIDDAELVRYFEEHKKHYYVQPSVTFTHVFFDGEKHGKARARELARRKLAQLHKNRASFSEAPRHGDRFLYHLNYVERTPDFVASHFGAPMANAVFELEPSDIVWRGPFESQYGAHIVMVTQNEPGRDATVEEIRGRIEQDAQRALVRDRTEQAIQNIVDDYDVQISYAQPDSKVAER